MKNIVFLVSVAFCISCGKEKKETMPKVKSPDQFIITTAPENKSVTSVGEIELDGSAIEVQKEYTDRIAYVQPTITADGVKGSHLYREMRVLLVRKQEKDTIVLTKQDFKRFTGKESSDYIVQEAATQLGLNNIMVPLYVSLCKPDTDVCFEFSVKLKDGKPVIEEISPE